MALTPGTRLGVYEVTAQLGVGGMGEVYRATDTKLKRQVAIKILPSSLAADSDRLARFQREAEVLASLNHPNIAAIYGLEDADGVKALVMELVEGEDLAQRIARGAVPLAETLPIAKQIADALEAAHEQGIVHRDLKPANIKIREDGTVKVLDFGLAKVIEPTRSATDMSQSPTITSPAMTRMGIILGTAAYMSPEQARGKTVDKRADIWAFGCVLYEMLTGRPPFAGDTISDMIANILDREPDWQVPATIAPGLVRLLKRCLDKDARRRLRDIGDARIDLEDLDRPAPVSRARRPRIARRGPVLVAGVTALLSLVVTYWAVSRGSDPRPATLASAPTPLTTYLGPELFPSFSPDGGQVAFAWPGEQRDNWDIYIKVVGSAGAPLRLTSHLAVERYAAWSPDGREIAFGRERAIFLVSPLGGIERKLVDFEVSSPMSWSPDGKRIAATRLGSGEQAGGVFLIPSDGGEYRRITSRTLPFYDQSPSFSPDGTRLAFASCNADTANILSAIITGQNTSFGSQVCDIHVTGINDAVAPTTRIRRVSSFAGLAWTPDGEAIVYGSGRSLWRMPASGFSEPVQLPFGTGAVRPATSFRGRRLAYTQIDTDTDIWMFENGRGSRRYLASTQSDAGGMFSPDGTRIAFSSSRSGNNEIWVANADGTQLLQLTSSGDRFAGSPQWSPDSHWIVYDTVTSSATRDIFIVDAAGGRPRPLVEHPAQDRVPSWSRDGKSIYFTSNRTGRDEIFRVPVSGGDQTQVTDQGGYVAFEAPDSASLFYTKTPSGPSPLFARPLAGGPERQILPSVYNRSFVVAAHGIYFIEAADDGRFPLRFLELASGKTRVLTQIDGLLDLYLSISPDGQRALYTLAEQTGADLMLVESFK